MQKAERIAKAWMPGTREGSNRPAWAHPEDLVKLLLELNKAHLDAEGAYMENCENSYQVAWLHDIVEDGKKGDGTPVTKEDLYHEGVHEDVITNVLHLSQRSGETKIEYLARIRKGAKEGILTVATIRVKLADRVCNLREGKDTFKPARWARVIKETKEYIVPMLDALPPVEKAWLGAKLTEAIDARPVEG